MPYSLLLGLATPLLPILGSELLLLVVLLFLLLQALRGEVIWPRWANPILLVFAAWTIAELCWGFDRATWEMVWNGTIGSSDGGFENLWLVFVSSPPFAWTVALCFLRFLAIAALASFFNRYEHERERFLSGLELGLAGSAVLTTALIAFPGSWIAPNQSDFWTSLSRVSGTFSDPNAFGIFIVLVLPLLAWRAQQSQGIRRACLLALSAVWVILGAFSGSRSFFLGLGIYLVLLALRAGKRTTLVMLFAAGFGVLVLNVAAGLAPQEFNTLVAQAPEGARRVLRALLIAHSAETFFSRFAFWSIGWRMWLDNIFFGLGFEHFRLHVPEYSRSLGFAIGAWTDNSNNFYLGLLAETGLLGALAFLMTLSALHWKESPPNRFAKSALLALAVLLLFGPHIAFTEVAILCALLLALGCDFQPRSWSRSTYVLAAFLVAAILYRSSMLPRGFYAWEQEGAHAQRWTARQANDVLSCNSSGKATLSVRALTPNLETSPVHLHLRAGEINREVELRDFAWQEIQLECPAFETQSSQRLELRYQLEVDRVWVPARVAGGADARILGVQVR
ncbi:MAG: O-antigen ligase family protein [Deltaproteobacteria bacterium]|nr:O-antigen ligase family protein [Deltaproteobacteria bacterium]